MPFPFAIYHVVAGHGQLARQLFLWMRERLSTKCMVLYHIVPYKPIYGTCLWYGW
jgi:hypothetical protein